MEQSFEIHIRNREQLRQVVSEGIGAILSREFMRDHYVADVDCYQEELIIYIKEKYDAKLRVLEDVRKPSTSHLTLVPRNEE